MQDRRNGEVRETRSGSDPYWTRHEGKWCFGERVDPVVWPGITGPLSAAELATFDRDGYLFLEGLFSPTEAIGIERAAEALVRRARPQQPEVITEPGSDDIRSIFRIHRTPELRGACADRRVVSRVRQVLGSDVTVHQSRINFKPGLSGKEFFWHSDFETWHSEDGMPRMRAVSASVFVTESNEFNGPLMVVPGSHSRFLRCAGRTPENHHERSLRRQEYGIPSREALLELVSMGGIVAPKGPAGSVVIFDCNLMHGSVSNLSPYPRVNLFTVYNSVENRLEEPFAAPARRPEFLAEQMVEVLAVA
jgi:ectoine hydroxylase